MKNGGVFLQDRNTEDALPVAARFKACVCGHSLAGAAVSSPARNMDVCLRLCVLSGRGLCDGPISCAEEAY
jgi:hypothetical protein